MNRTVIINDDAGIPDTCPAVLVDRNYDLEAAERDTAGIESARGSQRSASPVGR